LKAGITAEKFEALAKDLNGKLGAYVSMKYREPKRPKAVTSAFLIKPGLKRAA
jgi:hypothetical protein